MTIDERLVTIITELQGAGITLEEAEVAFRAKYVYVALQSTKGNVTAASSRIGVHRNTMHNHLRATDHELLRGAGYRRRRVFRRSSTNRRLI
jgi:transcriptional regulator of acetoin/glycerol metabolism